MGRKTFGMLNGQDPDLRDIAVAPQLAALACLYAATDAANLALLAAHPELRLTPPHPTSLISSAAEDILHATADLHASIIHYCSRLGLQLLWLPDPRRPHTPAGE